MINGVNGALLSRDALERVIPAMLGGSLGEAGRRPALKAYRAWHRVVRDRLGPASSGRAVFDIAAAPLVSQLGYRPQPERVVSEIFQCVLEADGLPVAVLLVTAWGRDLDATWRQAVRTGNRHWRALVHLRLRTAAARDRRRAHLLEAVRGVRSAGGCGSRDHLRGILGTAARRRAAGARQRGIGLRAGDCTVGPPSRGRQGFAPVRGPGGVGDRGRRLCLRPRRPFPASHFTETVFSYRRVTRRHLSDPVSAVCGGEGARAAVAPRISGRLHRRGPPRRAGRGAAPTGHMGVAAGDLPPRASRLRCRVAASAAVQRPPVLPRPRSARRPAAFEGRGDRGGSSGPHDQERERGARADRLWGPRSRAARRSVRAPPRLRSDRAQHADQVG